MYDVPKEIEAHAAWTRLRTKVSMHKKKKKKDDKGHAAADRQDLKDAQAAA